MNVNTDPGNYRLNKNAKSLVIQVFRTLHNDLLEYVTILTLCIRSHAGAGKRGAKLVLHLFKRKVTKKNTIRMSFFPRSAINKKQGLFGVTGGCPRMAIFQNVRVQKLQAEG